mmetsp:Transcript_18203/g.61380  ORF Transcript_18203/g.61380 Transcript_18203/m.61380 type:complete len:370 (+) Transcript_18203:373-1482(+)
MMAHSECFQVRMATRPPGFKADTDAARPSRNSSNSRFTAIRSAWNVSLAGCMAWYSLPFAAATKAAKGLVRVFFVSSPLCFASSTASAIRRAAKGCSPPYNSRARASSARPTRKTNSMADSTPSETSNRMSKGASTSGLKPRPPSSCGDEMPISSKTPVTMGFAVTSPSKFNDKDFLPACCAAPCCGRLRSSATMCENGAWCMTKRESSPSRIFPAATASGSMSKACSVPRGPSAAKILRVWPPRPKVPSTYVPLGSCHRPKASTHSPNMAGVCVPTSCSVPEVVAQVTLTLRLPSSFKSRRSAARMPASVSNLTKPRMTRPEECSRISLGPGGQRAPQPSKNFSTCASVASGGKNLRKTSYGGESGPE